MADYRNSFYSKLKLSSRRLNVSQGKPSMQESSTESCEIKISLFIHSSSAIQMFLEWGLKSFVNDYQGKSYKQESMTVSLLVTIVLLCSTVDQCQELHVYYKYAKHYFQSTPSWFLVVHNSSAGIFTLYTMGKIQLFSNIQSELQSSLRTRWLTILLFNFVCQRFPILLSNLRY